MNSYRKKDNSPNESLHSIQKHKEFIDSLGSNKESASTTSTSNLSSKFKDFHLATSFTLINSLLISSINESITNNLLSIFTPVSIEDNKEFNKYINSCIDTIDPKILGEPYKPKVSDISLEKICKVLETKQELYNNSNESFSENNKSIKTNNDSEIKILSLGKTHNLMKHKSSEKNINEKTIYNINKESCNIKNKGDSIGYSPIECNKTKTKIIMKKETSKKNIKEVGCSKIIKKSPSKIQITPNNSYNKTKEKHDIIIPMKKMTSNKSSPRYSPSIKTQPKQTNNHHNEKYQSFALNNQTQDKTVKTKEIPLLQPLTTRKPFYRVQSDNKSKFNNKLNLSIDNILQSNSNVIKRNNKMSNKASNRSFENYKQQIPVYDNRNNIFQVLDTVNIHHPHPLITSKTTKKIICPFTSDNNDNNESIEHDDSNERNYPPDRDTAGFNYNTNHEASPSIRFSFYNPMTNS